MVEYSIVFARSARRELERLDREVVKRVLSHVAALASNPRPPGCVKLRGSDDLWRIRIGEYRVIYSIDDKTRIADVSAVRHRGDAYR